jgi:ABC-type nitrate/sulfonate/bicarbonate transport system permease component
MRAIRSALAIVAILFLWELGARFADLPQYMLPRPTQLGAFVLANIENLLVDALWTTGEGLAGMAVALAIGLPIAVMLTVCAPLRLAVRPVIVGIQSTPILAIAPIVGAWLGPGFASKATLAALICLPVIVVTVADGLQRVSSDESDLFVSMKASSWQILWFLRVPRAAPSCWLALEVSFPLAILGAIVGEFVGASHGLGFLIMRASYYLETAAMFSAVLTAALISLMLVGGTRHISRRFAY